VMEALLEEGCIIVATSNRAPWDLNRHGLHEDLFGHFVQNLLEACRPYQLSAEQDYRRLLVPPPPARCPAQSVTVALSCLQCSECQCTAVVVQRSAKRCDAVMVNASCFRAYCARKLKC